MSRPISRGVSIKRFNTHPMLRFSFFFYSLFFFFGREKDGYLRQRGPTYSISKESKSESVLFDRISTHACIFSRNAEFPLDIYQPASRYLLYRKECRVTLIRRGGYAVYENATTLRIPKGYSDIPPAV